MELKVLRDEFAKAVAESVRFVSSRAQIPVLNNIVLRASGVGMHVEATNLEMSLSARVGAKIKTEGEIAVPAKMISELVNSLDSESVDLSSEGEVLKLSTSGFSGRVSGMNTSDFPEILTQVPQSSTKLNAQAFILFELFK